MLVFLDFEASSLGKHSYPIEVAWIFADGRSEEHLIRPATGWTEWHDEAEAIHRIKRDRLERDGADHTCVAQRMVDVLSGHDILAGAPSWDGKWLSTLLRTAGLPRHALRLRRTDDAIAECATREIAALIPAALIPADRVRDVVADLIVRARLREPVPAHRALADARAERERWLRVMEAARAMTAAQPAYG